ncbi:glycosyltransferase [Gemelliphila palaticanis]|uniref:Glycosyltransferase n=1 Tax=Gemelliphila palaticanis TaxID=81950 RepID=A0ABX2SYH1_9BACL|nr:glycosyltransferase [Gemella palaticanis]MBF0715442.1 glycosyltransferase [Gemella palaticanis]NYS47372.1 glycosyltransferase [Gemella palaticanis]
MDNKELITVVVPVYNVEKYLEKCVTSILNQTYKNLEIILVDDGSTDKSGELCDYLAERDSRIVVYHKLNGGLSDARNYGVDRAKGEYIGFVDSDDYIHSDMYLNLYDAIIKENSDVAECGVTRVYKNKELPHYDGDEYYFSTDARGFLFEYLKMNKIYGSAWCKLIKSNIAKSIKFPKGKIYEDIFYNYDLLNVANKFTFISGNYYYYYMREGSITTERFNDKHMDIIEAIDNLHSYTVGNYPEFIYLSEVRKVTAYLSIFSQIIVLDNYSDYSQYKLLLNFLKSNFYKILKNRAASNSLKVALILLKIHPVLYRFALKKYRNRSIIND